MYILLVIDYFGSLKLYFQNLNSNEKFHFLTEICYSRMQKRATLIVVTLTHIVIDLQEIIGRRLGDGVWTYLKK